MKYILMLETINMKNLKLKEAPGYDAGKGKGEEDRDTPHATRGTLGL